MVYTVKLNHDGSLARLKICVVAKGYSQVYEMDYQDTSPVAKLTSMQILASLVFLVNKLITLCFDDNIKGRGYFL